MQTTRMAPRMIAPLTIPRPMMAKPSRASVATAVAASNGRSREDRPEQDRRRSSRTRRAYTIQDVIKRGQIMLVQVVKEERGSKGAAVTTYLSLAGRYCVLMPNTARGGGISRKITVASDRKRLKSIVESLEIPGGMAVIVRTAGIGRTKPDIKRDFDDLAKTWEQIREVTLQSRAPALILRGKPADQARAARQL